MNHEIKSPTPTIRVISRQREMPFAIVQGSPVTELPHDLYIPPDALEVFLEAFEGPLDLLLYLIKKQNLDILDIPIARITAQYIAYIEMMQGLKLELAAEYLVMAAMLAEIKSRLLLPRPRAVSEEEGDPRAELVRRLQEYERYKKAAEDLDTLPRVDRDVHLVAVDFRERRAQVLEPEVSLDALLTAFNEVLRRAEMFAEHHIDREPLSVRERMSLILQHANRERFAEFSEFFTGAEGRAGAVVTFVALLELLKERVIELIQNQQCGPIYIKLAA